MPKYHCRPPRPHWLWPSAVALLARGYEGVNDGEKTKWYRQAKAWFRKVLANQPNDLSVVRTAISFFVQTNQSDEVEAQLTAIVKRGSSPETKATFAWARRTLSCAGVVERHEAGPPGAGHAGAGRCGSLGWFGFKHP